MLPNFLRDLSEVRKTGLSPEKCIQHLSNREYGILTKYVKKMASQISWGVAIKKVMENFANNVTVWSAKAVAFILLEIVDLGGGTPKMFENIASFTQQMKEISRERASNLRTLIFVPYFGAIMMIATTIMMMSFLIGSPVGTSTVSTSLTGEVLLTGVVAQSWIMGFASGKMGEGSIRAGFKHAAALVAISLLTIFVLKGLIGGVV